MIWTDEREVECKSRFVGKAAAKHEEMAFFVRTFSA